MTINPTVIHSKKHLITKYKQCKDTMSSEQESILLSACADQIDEWLDAKLKKMAKKQISAKVRQLARRAVEKIVLKVLTKHGAKMATKKIPGAGLVAGVIFGAERLFYGDVAGACSEMASGAASCVPGVGTAASLAIDIASIWPAILYELDNDQALHQQLQQALGK